VTFPWTAGTSFASVIGGDQTAPRQLSHWQPRVLEAPTGLLRRPLSIQLGANQILGGLILLTIATRRAMSSNYQGPEGEVSHETVSVSGSTQGEKMTTQTLAPRTDGLLPVIELPLVDSLDSSTLMRFREQLDNAITLRPERVVVDLPRISQASNVARVGGRRGHRLAARLVPRAGPPCRRRGKTLPVRYGPPRNLF
jgi:hypothetical protein